MNVRSLCMQSTLHREESGMFSFCYSGTVMYFALVFWIILLLSTIPLKVVLNIMLALAVLLL